MSRRNTFDPDDIRKEDMRKLGEGIEGFIETLTRVMIIPDNLREEKKQIEKDLEVVNQMVKDFKKGKHRERYFRDYDEWNFMD